MFRKFGQAGEVKTKKMNKKIISIGIVTIFLLISLSAFSAIGMKEEKLELETRTEKEVDLQLTVENLQADFFGRFIFRKFEGYICIILIKNIGTAPMKKSDYPNFEIRYTAEYEGKEVYNRTFGSWDARRIGNSLDPGEEIGWGLFWPLWCTRA